MEGLWKLLISPKYELISRDKRGTSAQKIYLIEYLTTNRSYQYDSVRYDNHRNLADQVTQTGETFWNMSQCERLIWSIRLLKQVKVPELGYNEDAWGSYNFLNKQDPLYCQFQIKILRLTRKYEIIKFERSIKIYQKWGSSWPYQGRLGTEIKQASQVTWYKENSSRNSQTDQGEWENGTKRLFIQLPRHWWYRLKRVKGLGL